MALTCPLTGSSRTVMGRSVSPSSVAEPPGPEPHLWILGHHIDDLAPLAVRQKPLGRRGLHDGLQAGAHNKGGPTGWRRTGAGLPGPDLRAVRAGPVQSPGLGEPREHLGQGDGHQKIAAALGIGHGTVGAYVRRAGTGARGRSPRGWTMPHSRRRSSRPSRRPGLPAPSRTGSTSTGN